jgi:hypothetical protein
MLRVAVRRVHPDKVGLLRDWLAEVDGPRREEALATLVDEGCRHELALLVDGPHGPTLVYVMEVEDVEASPADVVRSSHPIDADHQRVMTEALGDHLPLETLLDLHP